MNGATTSTRIAKEIALVEHAPRNGGASDSHVPARVELTVGKILRTFLSQSKIFARLTSGGAIRFKLLDER